MAEQARRAERARIAVDVELMDVRLPGLGGIEATRRITTLRNPPKGEPT